MKIVNNDPTINCPNANWNGIDHELLQRRHLRRRRRARVGSRVHAVHARPDLPVAAGSAQRVLLGHLGRDGRPDQRRRHRLPGRGTHGREPARRTPPPIPVLMINTPADAGDCAAGAAQFGPPLTAAGTTGEHGPRPSTALMQRARRRPMPARPLHERGRDQRQHRARRSRARAAFTIKVKNAQNAGASGVVVANTARQAGVRHGRRRSRRSRSRRSASRNAHGDLIKGELAAGSVERDPDGQGRRAAAGGQLPLADGRGRDRLRRRDPRHVEPDLPRRPGQGLRRGVPRATRADGGGVHTNSGVPNHGYALLVDGGTYNGQTIAAIGLTKAAHIYWRAQSVYQTPTTDFDDHADALEASCTDLIGQSLKALGTSSTPTGPSGQSITAADCASVTAMIAAVELRTGSDRRSATSQPAAEPEHARPLRQSEECPGHLRGGLRGRARRLDADEPGRLLQVGRLRPTGSTTRRFRAGARARRRSPRIVTAAVTAVPVTVRASCAWRARRSRCRTRRRSPARG